MFLPFYFEDGRLYYKIDANGAVAQNIYDPASGDLANTIWSDGKSTTLNFGYDRLGRTTAQSVQSGIAENFSYSLDGKLLSSSVTGNEILDNFALNFAYHPVHGQPTTIGWQTLTYDDNARLETIEYPVWEDAPFDIVSVTYSYPTNCNMVVNMDVSSSDCGISRHIDWDYTNNRIRSISWDLPGMTESFAYEYASGTDRIKTKRYADGSRWEYAYDREGRLVGAVLYNADGTPRHGRSYGWKYDAMGNMIEGGILKPNGQLEATFEANNLNQHTTRSWGSTVRVAGSAAPDATVTVNDIPTARQNEWFCAEMNAANTERAIDFDVAVRVVRQEGGHDLFAEKHGNLFVPKAVETVSYNPRGDLVADSRFDHTFDVFGRLTKSVSKDILPGVKVENEYYPDGRRALKKVSKQAFVNTVRFDGYVNLTYDGPPVPPEIVQDWLSTMIQDTATVDAIMNGLAAHYDSVYFDRVNYLTMMQVKEAAQYDMFETFGDCAFNTIEDVSWEWQTVAKNRFYYNDWVMTRETMDKTFNIDLTILRGPASPEEMYQVELYLKSEIYDFWTVYNIMDALQYGWSVMFLRNVPLTLADQVQHMVANDPFGIFRLEPNAIQSHRATLDYVWGLDVQGQTTGRTDGNQTAGIGGLVAVIVDGWSWCDILYPVSDRNGNITRMVSADFITRLLGEHSNPHIAASFDYDPYGVLITETFDGPWSQQIADYCSLRFQSKYYDKETELYYFGYRFYDPRTGKWLSRDPIEEKGGLNTTAYCNNDPINKLDPTGLMTISEWESLSPDEQKKFYQTVLGRHRTALLEASKMQDIPKDLLAAIILAEQVDQTAIEDVRDILGAVVGANTSVGLAQISIETAMKYKLVSNIPKRTNVELVSNMPLGQFGYCIVITTPKQVVSEQLQDPTLALHAAAKYIRDVVAKNAALGQAKGYNTGVYSKLYDFSVLSGKGSNWHRAWLPRRPLDSPRTPYNDFELAGLGEVVKIMAAAYTSPPFYDEKYSNKGWGLMVKGFAEYDNWGIIAQMIFEHIVRENLFASEVPNE